MRRSSPSATRSLRFGALFDYSRPMWVLCRLAPRSDFDCDFEVTPDWFISRLNNRSSQRPHCEMSSACLRRHAQFSSRCPASLVRLKLVCCPHPLASARVALPSMSAPARNSPGPRIPAVMLFNGSSHSVCSHKALKEKQI